MEIEGPELAPSTLVIDAHIQINALITIHPVRIYSSRN